MTAQRASRSRRRMWAAVLMVALAACQGPGIEGGRTGEGVMPQAIEPVSPKPSRPAIVPTADISLHSVPIEEIYFDTFNPVNRAVPLDQATPELIKRLIDAIPPIHDPKYETIGEADWLTDGDMVIGYASGDQAWAYPLKILNFHEIVNDNLDGEPVLISYCPLCYSGIAYSRRLGDRVLTFGNTSALYESDMVMLDYETGSYWWQVAGEAIVGPLTGQGLTILPSTVTNWRGWRDLHPETHVLSRDTGFSRNYTQDPFSSYAEILDDGQFAFPVGETARDPRLSPATEVLALKVAEESVAYPLGQSTARVVHDEVGESPVVVFIDPEFSTGAAFHPLVDGELLRFTWSEAGPVDDDTGTLWDLSGRAVRGPLNGERLEVIPTKVSFWFAVVAADPEIEVYGSPG